ncbi:hypothetical protein ABZ650_02720 [Streptomyces griseoviridis]|uniref:hypothetical protein n=1 Tax=Streptomyces griseoviridis TaxID=45398 RepID=UPI0033F42164
MTRRTVPVAVVIAAASALALTACGGNDDAKANDKIAGADVAETSAAPSDETSTTERPQITLPGDLTDTFESWKTGDSAKDAVLQDVARRIDATNYAITQGDAEHSALDFYYGDAALAEAKDWVQSVVKAGYSITGANRYYNAKIDVFDSKSAGVVYCEDQGKAYAKDRKSGKIHRTAVTSKSYVLYSSRVEKSAQGIWKTTKLTSQRGNKSCTP